MEKPTAAESPRKRRSPPRHRKPLDLKNTPVTPPPDSAPEASPIAPLSAARHAGPTADSPTPDADTRAAPKAPDQQPDAAPKAPEQSDAQATSPRAPAPERVLLSDLCALSPEALVERALALGVDRPESKRPRDLFCDLLRMICARQGEIAGGGTLEILSDGYGFLRSPRASYLPGPDDIYLSPAQIRRFNLRVGDSVFGALRPPSGRGDTGDRYFSMWRIDTVNGEPPQGSLRAALFDTLTPLYPQERLRLEHQPDEKTTRIIDLFTPIGKGQRCLIVAPPRTGKTMLLQNIAHAITANHPEVTLIVLLIDERPEEVTDMARSVHGEVVSSTFDEAAARHIQVAEMVLEKAKRLVEQGRDVVILLDSITRLARAYNAVLPPSGKILSGGVDANALHRPKRFFGAARNVEEGGSLTIIGTALVETGSRMDEVIFEEFKGTGNAEIVLDRKLMEKRLFPCLDLNKSGTRKEELLMDEFTRNRVWILRQVFQPLSSIDALGMLLEKVKGAATNRDFLDQMSK